MKEVIGFTLMFTLLMFGSYRDSGTRDYQLRQRAVDNIVYNYSQIAGKKGVLNESSYQELVKDLSIYGDFEIRLIAEKFEGDTPIVLEGESIIDFDLRGNEYDLITIYAEDKEDLFINKVYRSSPMGIEANYKLYSRGCSFIE